MGKIVDAEYDKEINMFVINGYTFEPCIVKGIVIKEEYTIKKLNDGYEYKIYAEEI